jgi:sortase A
MGALSFALRLQIATLSAHSVTTTLAMRDCVRPYLRTTGEVLISVGLVMLGFMAYMYWGTALREGNAQHGFVTELGRQWTQGGTSLAVLANPNELALGQPFALIMIPRLGHSWKFAVVQGTGLPQLALGPGHVPGTALPGQVGNFAIAGHRVTAGNPFWSLPSLRAGDLVYIETIAGTYQYQVTGRPDLVAANDTAWLSPVPGHPGAAARQRMITLITCDPPWTGTNRVIVTGVLTATLPRSQGIEG